MPRSERAKQFMPFDALKGLKQALREKEIEYESRAKAELSEDEASLISNTLSQIKNGDEVIVTYYKNGYNHTNSGTVKLKKNDGLLIVGDQEIKIEDIVKIEIV